MTPFWRKWIKHCQKPAYFQECWTIVEPLSLSLSHFCTYTYVVSERPCFHWLANPGCHGYLAIPWSLHWSPWRHQAGAYIPASLTQISIVSLKPSSCFLPFALQSLFSPLIPSSIGPVSPSSFTILSLFLLLSLASLTIPPRPVFYSISLISFPSSPPFLPPSSFLSPSPTPFSPT